MMEVNSFLTLCYEERDRDNFYRYYLSFVLEIIELREIQGKSVEYMAREIGISEEEYIEFEKLDRVATKIVAKAMDILGINMVDLIAEKDPKDEVIKQINMQKEEINLHKNEIECLMNEVEVLQSYNKTLQELEEEKQVKISLLEKQNKKFKVNQDELKQENKELKRNQDALIKRIEELEKRR